MLDVKQAVKVAKEKAEEMLEQEPIQLEEVEREEYKGKDVWSITLSFPLTGRKSNVAISSSRRPNVDYKRFLIDVESGDLVAMKLRDISS